jgi:hypothetical protein
MRFFRFAGTFKGFRGLKTPEEPPRVAYMCQLKNPNRDF